MPHLIEAQAATNISRRLLAHTNRIFKFFGCSVTPPMALCTSEYMTEVINLAQINVLCSNAPSYLARLWTMNTCSTIIRQCTPYAVKSHRDLADNIFPSVQMPPTWLHIHNASTSHANIRQSPLSLFRNYVQRLWQYQLAPNRLYPVRVRKLSYMLFCM